jgi:hypothetical protein
MNRPNKLERIRVEVVMACFKAQSMHLLHECEENRE